MYKKKRVHVKWNIESVNVEWTGDFCEKLTREIWIRKLSLVFVTSFSRHDSIQFEWSIFK